MDKLVEWLLEGPPWVQYRTRIDLLGQPESNSEVAANRQAMLAHPKIRTLLSELSGWPGSSLKRHNDASHLLHKLVFISDLGIRASDPGVGEIVKSIEEHQSKEGAFQTLANISPQYGGTGKDQLAMDAMRRSVCPIQYGQIERERESRDPDCCAASSEFEL